MNNAHGQSPNTDISPSEIDAFDAYLNELSDENRFPNSWSGSRHGRPHDRPELRDASLLADSLASFAVGFQEQVDVAHESRFGASGPRPELWETIMLANTAPASGSVTTTTSWSDPLPSPSLQPVNPLRSSVRRAPRWSIFANIALVLAILIAGYGVWNNRGGFGGDGDDNNGIAWQPQTPTNEIAAMSSPDATPAATTECDLTADMPIFSHTADVEFDGTALRLSEGGQLILSCAADPDGTVVADDVLSAVPFEWPGMVTITLDTIKVDQPRLAVLDLATGKIVEVGHRNESMRMDLFHESDSPWLVAPALDNPEDWGITDLRTMETRWLSEYAGGSLPFNVSVLVSSNGAAGSIAIGLVDPENQLQFTVAPNDDELPGAILILDNSFEASHWIPKPEGIVGLTDAKISPDGKHLAFTTGFSDEDPGADSSFVILQASDGAVVEESPLSDDPDSNALWANDSSGLLYAQDATLSLLSVIPGQEPNVLLEQSTPGELGNLKSTYDPHVFLVDRTMTEDLVDENAAGIEQHVYSVNVVTGEVITFDGWDASANTWPPQVDTQFLVMYDPMLPATETTMYQVFDAVTGEKIDGIFEAPNVLSEDSRLQPTSVTSTEDGGTEVFGFNSQSVYLMRSMDGVSGVTLLPTLPSDEPQPTGLELSPYGTYLSLRTQVEGISSYWLLDLRADNASWIEVPAEGETTSYYMRFVKGTGE